MNDSCPVVQPNERRAAEILREAESSMMTAIEQVIIEATSQVGSELASIPFQQEPPAADYFAAVAHQRLFLRLCGADVETLKGGDPAIAEDIIKNSRSIVDHYWKDEGAGH